jgi:hypothetical protein
MSAAHFLETVYQAQFTYFNIQKALDLTINEIRTRILVF